MPDNCGCPEGTIAHVLQPDEAYNITLLEENVAEEAGVSVEFLRHRLWNDEGIYRSIVAWFDENCNRVDHTATPSLSLHIGRTICVPYQLPVEVVTEAEREAWFEGDNELIADREADRSRQPVQPPTQEDLNRLMAQIATAQHYETLALTANDPSNLMSDALLLDGQEFDEDIAVTARRDWILASLRANRIDFESTDDLERLEALMRLYVYRPALEQLAGATCNKTSWGQVTDEKRAICDEFNEIFSNLNDYSLEYLSEFAIRVRDGFSNISERLFSTFFEYYYVVDDAQIEEILQGWDKEQERAQLDKLLEQIALIPAQVLGVSMTWLVNSVSNYYGQMEARHQMLSNIVRPREEAAQQQFEMEAEARAYYIQVLWEAADAGLIESTPIEWQSYSLGHLRGQAYNAALLLGFDDSFEFDFVEADIFNIDMWRGAREVRSSALLILSFIPIVGTVVDIIEAYHTIDAWLADDISDGEAVFNLALSLIGPLGDASRAIRSLANSGDAVADVVRASNQVSDIAEEVHWARSALVNDDIIGQMRRRGDELDEILGVTRTRETVSQPPNFRLPGLTDEEAYLASRRYWSERQDPQAYINKFYRQFEDSSGRLPFSADIEFSESDVNLSPPRSGRVIITQGQERIYIGAAYYNDNELFITLFHEEMHIRLANRARQGDEFALQLIENSAAEEFYVERIAQRYYAMFTNANGVFDYAENIHNNLINLLEQDLLNLRNANGLEGFNEFRQIIIQFRGDN